MTGLLMDVHFILRLMRRSPLVTLCAMLALGLGIGATGAIFAAVNGILLRPLPYAKADSLVMVWSDNTRETNSRNPVSPADFVPVAEELGIIEPLGTWVMQQACEKFVEWKQRFPEAGLECITVNVSARQLVQQGFVYLVEQTVEQNQMDPADLRLEITETALMDAPQFAAKVLAELREYGVSKKEIELASKLIEGMTARWDASKYHDEYRDARA